GGLRATAARRPARASACMKRAWAALAAAASIALAVEPLEIAPFSTYSTGSLPAPWRAQDVPRVPPAELALVRDDGATVLRVHSKAAAGAALRTLHASVLERPILAWRWKVDRVLSSDL